MFILTHWRKKAGGLGGGGLVGGSTYLGGLGACSEVNSGAL